MAAVEVGLDTGYVKLLCYAAVQDAGKAVHPSYVEGQYQGGAVQGIGLGAQRGVHLRRGR